MGRTVYVTEFANEPIGYRYNPSLEEYEFQYIAADGTVTTNEVTTPYEDERLVSSYVRCLSEVYSDRSNDVYEPEVTGFSDYEPRPEPSLFKGFDVLSTGEQEGFGFNVRCWYCDGSVSFDEYLRALSPHLMDRYLSDQETATGTGSFTDWFWEVKRQYVRAMLEHYDECYAEHKGLPILRTWFAGHAMRVQGYASPSICRVWRVKPEML